MHKLPTRQLLDARDVDALAGALHRLMAEVADLSARVGHLESGNGLGSNGRATHTDPTLAPLLGTRG